MNIHICKFEKIPHKFEIRLFDPGVYAIEESILRVELFFKGQRKTKKIRQCRTCGKYSIECPYCHHNVETDSLPLEIICNSCNKMFRVRTY